MILRDLTERYDLPRLKPLYTFGTWRDTYPELVNGRKRGFSYFQHERNQPFTPAPDHNNELLVTASTDNYRSDTHWLREDIDHFLVNEAKAAGIPVLEGTIIQHLQTPASSDDSWRIRGRRANQPVTIEAAFLIDATGPAGVLARHLNLPDLTANLHTQSHALFSHFDGLPTWHDFSTDLGAKTEDHPFYCDDSALHHCIDRGWMWMLRFVNNRVSAGFVLDSSSYRINYSVPPEEDWHALLGAYPSLQTAIRTCLACPNTGPAVSHGQVAAPLGTGRRPQLGTAPPHNRIY